MRSGGRNFAPPSVNLTDGKQANQPRREIFARGVAPARHGIARTARIVAGIGNGYSAASADEA
jgi:hypothetical protein